jgi:hypothetical protein
MVHVAEDLICLQPVVQVCMLPQVPGKLLLFCAKRLSTHERISRVHSCVCLAVLCALSLADGCTSLTSV